MLNGFNGFNGYDIIVGVLVLVFCVIGFKTGIISTFFYILSGYFGLYVAKKYCDMLGMNFYLVLVLVAIATILAGSIVGRLVRDAVLGNIDNVLGLFFGALFGIMVISIVMFPVMDKLSWRNQVYVVTSYSGGNIIPWVQKMLPPIKEVSLNEIKGMIAKQKNITQDFAEEQVKSVEKKIKTIKKEAKKRMRLKK
ncbi:MAG: CvpA family protein [Elusimicrobia bacterium]|nr:CvpA family protein [Elusimicrobiota bacterium]